MERINFEENLIMARATWCLIRCKISCAIITFQADDRCNKVHYTRNFRNSFMPSTSHFHWGLLYFTNALLWSLRPMFHAVSPKMFHAFLRTAPNQCMNFCNVLWPASLPSVSISCNWFTGSKLPLYVAYPCWWHSRHAGILASKLSVSQCSRFSSFVIPAVKMSSTKRTNVGGWVDALLTSIQEKDSWDIFSSPNRTVHIASKQASGLTIKVCCCLAGFVLYADKQL